LTVNRCLPIYISTDTAPYVITTVENIEFKQYQLVNFLSDVFSNELQSFQDYGKLFQMSELVITPSKLKGTILPSLNTASTTPTRVEVRVEV
jgi:hypothetical protein